MSLLFIKGTRYEAHSLLIAGKGMSLIAVSCHLGICRNQPNSITLNCVDKHWDPFYATQMWVKTVMWKTVFSAAVA